MEVGRFPKFSFNYIYKIININFYKFDVFFNNANQRQLSMTSIQRVKKFWTYVI